MDFIFNFLKAITHQEHYNIVFVSHKIHHVQNNMHLVYIVW